MKLIVRLIPVLLLGVLALPSRAEAADVRVGLGADYWAPGRGLMHLTLGVDGAIARYIRVGGRFGALATTGPTNFGAPIDLTIRAELARKKVYIEGLVGPWLLFGAGDSFLRLHGGLGFGLQSGGLSFGLEVGWLDPRPHAGLRLGFRI